MKVSKVRKILVSSIVVPISVTNSDAFKKRNKNLKANDKVVNTSIICSKLGYIINSKEICMKNDIFVNNLKTNEDLLDALNEKQVISEAKQIDKCNKKAKEFVKSINPNKSGAGTHKDEEINKVSCYNFAIKPIKSRSQMLDEKADIAEKYLQNLGNELLRIRNSLPENIIKQSSITLVSDSSLMEKNLKGEEKIRIGEKRIISDIKQLTLNLMQLEVQMNGKIIKRKCKSFKKKKGSLLEVKTTTPKYTQQAIQTLAKKFNTIKSADECENYFNQFNLRQEFEFNEIDKMPNSLSRIDINKISNMKTKRDTKSNVNSTKMSKKNLKDSCESISYFDSNNVSTNSECSQTISDDDFNTFFNSYKNHRKVEKYKISKHNTSISSILNKTESSNSCK